MKVINFREVLAVMRWSLGSIPSRPRGALVVVTGFFGVIIVFAAVLSIRDGLESSSHPPGGDSVVVIFGHNGALTDDVRHAAENAPGVARKHGAPLVAPDLVASVILQQDRPGLFVTEVMRGISPRFTAVIPQFRLVGGRMFRSGVDEAIVGTGAARLHPELSQGHVLNWNHRQWKIVGTYRTGQAVGDSEFWTSLPQLQAASNAGHAFSDLAVKLNSAADFPRFKAALDRQPGLDVTVETLTQRYLDFSGPLNQLLLFADGLITALMAVGAVFGALNVMYANVASRAGEFATLRALGFSRVAVLCAVLSEAVALALIGGGAGVAAAYLIFNGLEASTAAGAQIAFQFDVTPAAVASALLLAAAMGFAGGLFPSIQAARLPIARALRDS